MKYGASANCRDSYVGFMQTSDGTVDPKRGLHAKHVSEISSQTRGYGSAEAYVKTPFVFAWKLVFNTPKNVLFRNKVSIKNEWKLAM